MNESIVHTMAVLSNPTIESGIAAKILSRDGSVVRDVATGQIVKMLKEVPPVAANDVALRAPAVGQTVADLAKRLTDATKNNPKTAVGIGVGTLVVGGAAWGINSLADRRKRRKATELYEKLKKQDIERAEKDAGRLATDEAEDEESTKASTKNPQVFDQRDQTNDVIEFDDYREGKLA